jgi:hypothetical protein
VAVDVAMDYIVNNEYFFIGGGGFGVYFDGLPSYNDTFKLSSRGSTVVHYRTVIAHISLPKAKLEKKVADIIADNRGIIPLVAIER